MILTNIIVIIIDIPAALPPTVYHSNTWSIFRINPVTEFMRSHPPHSGWKGLAVCGGLKLLGGGGGVGADGKAVNFHHGATQLKNTDFNSAAATHWEAFSYSHTHTPQTVTRKTMQAHLQEFTGSLNIYISLNRH